jgi:hypothetical protein
VSDCMERSPFLASTQDYLEPEEILAQHGRLALWQLPHCKFIECFGPRRPLSQRSQSRALATMSASGHKQTLERGSPMSALPPPNGHAQRSVAMSAKCQEQTLRTAITQVASTMSDSHLAQGGFKSIC